MTKEREDVIKWYHLALIAACTVLGIISLEGADYFFILALRQIRSGESPSAAVYALTAVPFCFGFLSLFLALGFGSYMAFQSYFDRQR